MYHWHILSRPKSELINKVYLTQSVIHLRGDFYQIMQQEKEKYGIFLSDDEIM